MPDLNKIRQAICTDEFDEMLKL